MISDWWRNNQTKIILCNASLHKLSKATDWNCHWFGVKHCGSHKDYECADILLSLMFKIRQKSIETVALSSLLDCLTQSLHDQHHKKTLKIKDYSINWHLTFSACIHQHEGHGGLDISRIVSIN